MVNREICKKKYLSWVYGVDRKICHSGSLFGIMPISDPRERFFYPHHTPMKDTYSLGKEAGVFIIAAAFIRINMVCRPGPEVIKLFSCSTELSMKFFQLINVKMPTIVGILTFMSRKNSILGLSESEKS